MKIVLSRKGFDGATGGVPSPIFPDKHLVSLPIPDSRSPIHYRDISWDGYSLGRIVQDLTKGHVRSQFGAHLDPDLVESSLPDRHRDWRPLLGQVGAAQGHLRNQAVGVGDIFLFFGLFRQIEIERSHFAYVRGSSPKHLIWGWLQVGSVIRVDESDRREMRWAQYHPHFWRQADKTNTVYAATECLGIPGLRSSSIRGGGVFASCSSALTLTAWESQTPGLWRLPRWFYPSETKPPLTYHANMSRWRLDEQSALLSTVGRGQEFVLDCESYPEAENWLVGLFT